MPRFGAPQEFDMRRHSVISIVLVVVAFAGGFV